MIRRRVQMWAACVLVCAYSIFASACASSRAAARTGAELPNIGAASQPAFASYAAKVRSAIAETPPPKRQTPQSVESWDPGLGKALAAMTLEPTGERLRDIARNYGRLGIRDSAFTYYARALKVDPKDAAAYDGRARLWRDSGFAGNGLGDAVRAVYFAPTSAEARNTLGTLLEAIGALPSARAEYMRALELNRGADYALINLCHVETRLGRNEAVATCTRAVAETPGSTVARNNLGLAYAAAGDFVKAREAFNAAGDPATASYNMGIVFMAASRLPEAGEAFHAAWRSNPSMTIAAERLRQLDSAGRR